jgi:hypothetical protein
MPTLLATQYAGKVASEPMYLNQTIPDRPLGTGMARREN